MLLEETQSPIPLEAPTSPKEPDTIQLEPEIGQKLQEIFMPHAAGQIRRVYGTCLTPAPARFIHYTSAESALSIIRSKRFWMRNTNCMTDYSEVQHGYDIFLRFFSNESKRKEFIEVLDTCFPGVAKEAIETFDQTWGDIKLNTYIASLSEHYENEDLHGRLSMWRAFGGNVTRVGVVLKVPYFSQATADLQLIFSPVAYLSTAYPVW